jgi:HPr kinase/phosphorylase
MAKYTVSVAELVKDFDLKQATSIADLDDKFIEHAEINRPALQLSGFYEYFDSDRLQIIGIVEYTYLQKLAPEVRRQTLKKLFEHKLPCVVVCRNLEVFPEMIEFGNEHAIPVLSYSDGTTNFMGEVISWLRIQLAPRVTLHGVLVDVYGEGIFITGESGIGKSETALELIKRGHRLWPTTRWRLSEYPVIRWWEAARRC